MHPVYRSVAVGDIDIAYREAGPADAPIILALHGFPTASHMFRDLIPLLDDRYRVIAPDLPGFGNTKAPPRSSYAYSFDNLAKAVEGFTNALGLTRYALYVFDYGAPTGFRLAMAHPEKVTAIVSQNGNAYEEGFSKNWTDWETYWREPTRAHRDAVRSAMSVETIRDVQYLQGVPDKALVSPDGYTLDLAYLTRAEREEIQLDLILDYRSNVARYPDFQRYFREYRPPLLATWGKHDPFFIPSSAEAYRRDIPDAEIHLLDTGHFALETHAVEIAGLMRDFLDRKLAVK